LLSALLSLSKAACGTERWSVKTGIDPDAKKVKQTPVIRSTIDKLRAIAKPASLPADSRISPTELEVFWVNATMIGYKKEKDQDYHIVIEYKSNTMIVEIPDPSCVGSTSPFRSKIIKARNTFDSSFDATTTYKTCKVPTSITGVGFFDFIHGQTGVAPNGIELHPVLSIDFPDND